MESQVEFIEDDTLYLDIENNTKLNTLYNESVGSNYSIDSLWLRSNFIFNDEINNKIDEKLLDSTLKMNESRYNTHKKCIIYLISVILLLSTFIVFIVYIYK